jgi:hypothetical protein
VTDAPRQKEEQPGGNNPAWTTKEIAILRQCADKGADQVASAIEREFGHKRSVRAIRKRAHKMRISLRRRGSKDGLVLGQPRGVSWKAKPHTAAIRKAVVSGALDITAAEERIASDLADPPPVCPACGQRPQRNPKSGLCDACHEAHLTRDIEERAAAAREARAHQAAKQRAHRSKPCSVDGCDHPANGVGGRCWTHWRESMASEATS